MKKIIHIGLSKTGTTFLQKNLFPNIDDYTSYVKNEFPPLIYIDKNNSYYQRTLYKRKNIKSLKNNFINKKDIYGFWFKGRIDNHLNKDSNYIVSSEGLAGAGHAPLLNAKINAKMLKLIFGQVEIMLVLRRQEDYIFSMYRQLVFKENRYGRFISLDEFLKIKDNKWKNNFDWNKLYNIYSKTFGKDYVHIFPYELIKYDLKQFTSNFVELVDSKLKLPEDYFSSKDNVADVFTYFDGQKKYDFFKEINKYTLQEHFLHSNKKLEEITNIPFVSKWNY